MKWLIDQYLFVLFLIILLLLVLKFCILNFLAELKEEEEELKNAR